MRRVGAKVPYTSFVFLVGRSSRPPRSRVVSFSLLYLDPCRGNHNPQWSGVVVLFCSCR